MSFNIAVFSVWTLKLVHAACVSYSERMCRILVAHKGVYLIIEDDHDKHTEQHRLHQQDYVMSTEWVRERERLAQ